MDIMQQRVIRDRTAAIMIDWAKERMPPFTGESAVDFRDAITAAHLVYDEGKIELHRWVDAARRSGLSWAEIGDCLGITKQAAQQRFKTATAIDDTSLADDEIVIRLGATAFNEMRILREEGAKGHELMETGALKLVFRKTNQLWEYQRRIGGIWTIGGMKAEMREGGWAYVDSWPPFHYFKRPVEQ